MVENSIKEIGRIMTNSYYEYQKIRMASMNRMRDVIRKKLEGIAFDEVEAKKKEKDFKKRYSDETLFDKLLKLQTEGKISKDEYKYILKCWEMMGESKRLEMKYQRGMSKYISGEPIYTEFLSKIKGIGKVLSANLIKEFGDCSKYENVSKLWAHTGNDVKGGKAPQRRKGVEISYSPKLRTLTWKLSDSLLKSNKGYYRNIYDTEKEKGLNVTYEEGVLKEKYGKPYKKTDVALSRGHAHNRALRKMRKLFLSHFWGASRELNFLPTDTVYVEGYC